MANKGVLIGVIVALAVIVVGLVVYFAILPGVNQRSSNPASGSSGNQATGPDFSGNITAAHFETFPAGTQLQPGMIGTVTNTFKASDLVSVSGNSTVSKPVLLTIKIFDTNGNDMGVAWHGSQITIQTGPFGFGSISIPQTSGNYVLKIYLDNYESYRLPFSVL